MLKTEYNSVVPTEIWQMILRYSISVPDFFDPPETRQDQSPPWVLAKRDCSDESNYYEAERMRNALQRVCRSWHEYLQQYSHRFVCLTDVAHGNVPVQYLQSAIRVSFGDHSPDCCRRCKVEQLRAFLAPHVTISYQKLCNFILDLNHPLKAEIMGYEHSGYHYFYSFVSSHPLPGVICIQATNPTIPSSHINKILESLPSIRHIYANFSGFGNDLLSLRSSTLTSLSLTLNIIKPSSIWTDKFLYLPALRHLNIEGSSFHGPDDYDEPAWLLFVKILGKELRTLFLPREDRCRNIDVPGDIWSICPKLEDLFYLWGAPTTPPPEGHPIHTLGMSYILFRTSGLQEFDVLDWPGLRAIRIDRSWDYWMVNWDQRLTKSQMEWLDFFHISLEDERGETYLEYLSRVESNKRRVGSCSWKSAN
jgi:hypothetical protein